MLHRAALPFSLSRPPMNTTLILSRLALRARPATTRTLSTAAKEAPSTAAAASAEASPKAVATTATAAAEEEASRQWAQRQAALHKARQGYGGPNYKYSVEEYQQTQSAWPIHLMMVVLFGATIWQSYKVFSKKGFAFQQGYTLRDLGTLLPSPREPK